MRQPSRTYLLIEARLGSPLEDSVQKLRDAGNSWNAVALSVHQQTGVAITAETLRVWFADVPRQRQEVASA